MNKAFTVIIIVAIVALVGVVVWQHTQMNQMQSTLLQLENVLSSTDLAGFRADIQAVADDVSGFQTTLEELADIESELATNERTQQLTAIVYLQDMSSAQYYMATWELDKAEDYLDSAESEQDVLFQLYDEHDDLMEQKTAILTGD